MVYCQQIYILQQHPHSSSYQKGSFQVRCTKERLCAYHLGLPRKAWYGGYLRVTDYRTSWALTGSEYNFPRTIIFVAFVYLGNTGEFRVSFRSYQSKRRNKVLENLLASLLLFIMKNFQHGSAVRKMLFIHRQSSNLNSLIVISMSITYNVLTTTQAKCQCRMSIVPHAAKLAKR